MDNQTVRTLANVIKNKLVTEIKAKGIIADTQTILCGIHTHYMFIAYLLKYCHQIDSKYGTDTVIELMIELETRNKEEAN